MYLIVVHRRADKSHFHAEIVPLSRRLCDDDAGLVLFCCLFCC
jgi:hypothetical protein